MSRTILGQQQVQGINFVLTLQSWLKAINPNIYTGEGYTLTPDSSSNVVAANAYNLVMGYYNGDYTPVSGAPSPDNGVNATLGSTDYRPLYNGHASTAAVSIRNIANPLLYNYQYDQLYRMVRMDAWKKTGADWSSISKVVDFQESISYDENGNIKKYKRNGNNSFAGQPIGMDSLNYFYIPGTNQLDHVSDSVPSGNYPADIDGQTTGNYKYDSLGQLVSDDASRITHINWTAYGKIGSIAKVGDTTISYTYNPIGMRISRSVIHGTDTLTTWYVRDAAGNVISVYTYGDPSVHGKDLTQTELNMYGGSRLGIVRMNRDVQLDAPITKSAIPLLGLGDSLIFIRGNKRYELVSQVENVLAVISDKRYGVSGDDSTVTYYIPDVTDANDYYPFGSPQPGRNYVQTNAGVYRYGMNGMEKSDEIAGDGNSYTAEFWEYDPRLGRRWNVDMVVKPWESSYNAFADNPINLSDPNGDDVNGGGNGAGSAGGTNGGGGTGGNSNGDGDGKPKHKELEPVFVKAKLKKKKIPDERPNYPVWRFPGQGTHDWHIDPVPRNNRILEITIGNHTGPFGPLNRTSIVRTWGPRRRYYNSTANGPGGFLGNMSEPDVFGQVAWGTEDEMWIFTWMKEKYRQIGDPYYIEAQAALEFGYGRRFHLFNLGHDWQFTDLTSFQMGVEFGSPKIEGGPAVQAWGPTLFGYNLVGFGGSVVSKVEARRNEHWSFVAAVSLHHSQLWGQHAPGSLGKPMGVGSAALSLGIQYTIHKRKP
jgi:hypothetical protein